MAEFWAEWGVLAYLGAAGWAFFEGESFVLIAAALGRATGLVDPWALMLSVWIGSWIGDQVWFALGRRYGAAALRRFPGAERRAAAALRFLERYGVVFVLGFRFIYGIRNVASAACGMAGMNRWRFAVLNFIAAGIWAASFVGGGWFLGAWIGPDAVAWVLGGAAATAILWAILRHRRRLRLQVATAPAPARAALPPAR